ncbi:MAG: preprotein translocase subunit SecE [Patescibacteria group bacterium]
MRPLIEYLKAVRAELTHVSWPSRSQAVGYTVLVIAISLVTAGLLGAFDFVFTYLIELFLRTVAR